MTAAGRRRAKILVVLGIVAAVLAVRFATPSGGEWTSPDAWRASRAVDPFWTAALFVAASAVLIGLGVPRLTFAALGGALFGFSAGLALSLAGGLAGSYGTFLAARWTGHDWSRRRLAGTALARAARGEPTIVTVILLRQIPLPGAVINVGLGLSTVRHRAFLAGSLAGFLPQGVVVCLIASGLVQGSLSESLPRIVGGLGLLVLVAWLARTLRAVARRRGLVEEVVADS